MNEINVIYKRCLNCGKNLNHTEGKREKVFCNTTCRSNYWQKSERLEKKGLTVEQIVSAITKTWKKGQEVIGANFKKEDIIKSGVFMPDGKGKMNFTDKTAQYKPEIDVKPKAGVVINPDYVTVSYVEPKPEKMKGEKGIDYLIRLDEWEKSKNNK